MNPARCPAEKQPPGWRRSLSLPGRFPVVQRRPAQIDAAYRDKARWARMAIMNTARVGKFSSDRTIHEYAREIWKLPQVPV